MLRTHASPERPKPPLRRTARALPRLRRASERSESAVARPRNRDPRRPPIAAGDGPRGAKLAIRGAPAALHGGSFKLRS